MAKEMIELSVMAQGEVRDWLTHEKREGKVYLVVLQNYTLPVTQLARIYPAAVPGEKIPKNEYYGRTALYGINIKRKGG